MKCYGLPYGGLGFTSHLLTYYIILLLSNGRRPLLPWKDLSHSLFDLWLSAISLVGGFMVAVFTIVRCRNHWEIVVIGVWKLSMSVLNGVIGVHIATIVRKSRFEYW